MILLSVGIYAYGFYDGRENFCLQGHTFNIGFCDQYDFTLSKGFSIVIFGLPGALFLITGFILNADTFSKLMRRF